MGTRRAPTDPEIKSRALSMLAAGKASVPELARLLGVSTHMLWNWCREAQVDWRVARAAVINDEWNKF